MSLDLVQFLFCKIFRENDISSRYNELRKRIIRELKNKEKRTIYKNAADGERQENSSNGGRRLVDLFLSYFLF